uniref:G-protein coupled receptors family 3 profile domain-containing protein n=1 Tax=Pyxicephalus adspersus TaxID=30357 RepID=A0AAV3AHV9_PYXAD|nr:TPA: hypothetical protein GDO54_010407 [Pyxicephalus adspersus]
MLCYLLHLLLCQVCICQITLPSCRLDMSVIPGVFREGDVLIGGVFPIKRTKSFGNAVFTNNPSTEPFISFDFRSYRWLQAMIFAVQEINNNPNLLPNTTLGYAIYDTCDNIAEAVKEIFKLISGLGSLWYLQVSYFSSINILSNKQEYPSFFRTIPSDTFQTTALAAMVEHFGWKWVGTLAEDNDYGHLGVQLFTEHVVQLGVCIAFSETIPLVYSKTKYEQIAATIKHSSAKVIIVFSGDTNLTPLIWEVAKQNISGRTWLASEGWSTSAFVLEKDQSHFFSGTLGLAIPSGRIPGLKEFLFQVNPLREPEDPIIKQFWENIFRCSWPSLSQSQNVTNICTGNEDLSSVTNTYSDVSQLRITSNVYNAVYAIANALQSLIYCGNKPCKGVHDIQPWQLVGALKRVNFSNSGGNHHYFDQNGDPVAKYDVLNWQMAENGLLQYKKVGSYSDSTLGKSKLVMDEQETLWNGETSQPPVSVCRASCKPGSRKSILQGQPACCFTCIPCPDGEISNGTDFSECIKCDQDYWSNQNKTACIPKEIDYLSFGEPLGITFSTVASMGICQTIIVTLVFIKYRNTPIVRAQNLEMSFLLLVSLLLSFFGTFTFIGEPSSTLCVLRQTVFAISFVLNISCILVKTLVVIIAFTMTKPNQNVVKFFQRSHQRALVGLTTSVQIAICVGFLSSTSLIMKKNRDAVMMKIILECNRESELALLVAIGYIGLLALVCFVLAFLARNLPDNFNEAKFITFSLLVFVMVWFSFIPGYLSTSGKYVTAVEIFAILSSAAGLLVCIFFPKCYIILLQPSRNSKKNLIGQSFLKK